MIYGFINFVNSLVQEGLLILLLSFLDAIFQYYHVFCFHCTGQYTIPADTETRCYSSSNCQFGTEIAELNALFESGDELNACCLISGTTTKLRDDHLSTYFSLVGGECRRCDRKLMKSFSFISPSIIENQKPAYKCKAFMNIS